MAIPSIERQSLVYVCFPCSQAPFDIANEALPVVMKPSFLEFLRDYLRVVADPTNDVYGCGRRKVGRQPAWSVLPVLYIAGEFGLERGKGYIDGAFDATHVEMFSLSYIQ